MVYSLALFMSTPDRKRCRLARADSSRYVPDLPLQGLVLADEAAETRALAEAIVLESTLPTTVINLTTTSVRHMPMFLEYTAARRTWLDAELAWLARDALVDAVTPFVAAAMYGPPLPWIAPASWRP